MKYWVGLVALLFLAACTPAQPTIDDPLPLSPPATCTTKECFVSTANDCADLSLTFTEPAGEFTYATKGCVFTKTLVTPNANETQKMKTLLQGKSLTCKYENGKFDARWVNSLLYGLEYCEGSLKDVLGQLMAFA